MTTAMLAAVFVLQLVKFRLHRASNRKLDDLIVVVRENLGVQTNLNAAVVEIVKGYKAVTASTAREAKETLREVKDAVKAGVDAAAAAAEKVAGARPDSGTFKTDKG